MGEVADDRPGKPPQAAGGWAGSRDPQGRLLIDVRGPRFSAGITLTVLGIALIFQLELLVALQTLVFAVSAFLGLRWSPYGNLFRLLKRRLNLGPPPEVEAEAPPRFAQFCGFLFAGGALAAFALQAELFGWILVGIVVALASLQAFTGICIGCELYLIGRRLQARREGA